MSSGGWQPTGSGSPQRGSDQQPIPPHQQGAQDPASEATPARPDSNVIRPIPTGSAGPSFDALAMQDVLSRARDSRRFEAPEIEEEAPKRPFPLRALLVTLAVVLVVGMGAGLFYVQFLRNVEQDPDTIVEVTATATRSVLQTPQAAVRGYFEALADGDIEEALSYGPPGGSGSMLLLEPEAHAAMPVDSRPSDIEVITEDPHASEVEVSYVLGGEEVTTSVKVNRLDSGDYQLARTTVTVLTQVAGGDNLPMFINGTEADHTIPLEVVPGTYSLSTELPFIAYPSEASFRIQSLAYTDVTVFPVNPQLTAQGRDALLASAQTSLTRCMASEALTPTGCPNAIRATKPVVQGSVEWTLLNDPWSTFNPTLDSDDQTVGIATVSLEYRVTMTYTDGHTSGNNDLSRNVSISATMVGQSTDEVTVTWDR